MVNILLQDISHSYDNGKTWAIKGINLEFESGKRYAILGPSGAGKTTILKLICGLITPTRGKIYFGNADVTNLPAEKRNVAIVFQFPVVYRMSVLENLLFPLKNLKIPNSEKIRKAKEIAGILNIEHLLQVPANKLGPADKQIVSIGRALIRETRIILLDEPTSSIEPERKYEIMKILLEISKQYNKTMIFVTHEQTEALTFGEKIAVLSQTGDLLQFGTFEDIYYRPRYDFVGFFIGFPGMNILKATVEDQNIINFQNFKVKLGNTVAPVKAGTLIKVGIRPEDVILSSSPKQDFIPFEVRYVEDLGRNKYILHLQNSNTYIKAIHDSELPPGSIVWVNLPEERLHFFNVPDGRRLE